MLVAEEDECRASKVQTERGDYERKEKAHCPVSRSAWTRIETLNQFLNDRAAAHQSSMRCQVFLQAWWAYGPAQVSH